MNGMVFDALSTRKWQNPGGYGTLDSGVELVCCSALEEAREARSIGVAWGG
jgi:hypothetical protein